MDDETKKVIAFARKKYPKIDLLIEIYTMQIVWVSKRLAKELGYGQEEMMGISARDLMVLDPMQVLATISGFTKDAKGDTQTVLNKNGDKVQARADVSPFMFEGDPYLATSNNKILDKKTSKKKS